MSSLCKTLTKSLGIWFDKTQAIKHNSNKFQKETRKTTVWKTAERNEK